MARTSGLTLIGRAKGKRFIALAGQDRIQYDADTTTAMAEPRRIQRKASLADDAA